MGEARLAVIPARGGSKRVPRKNVRLLDGRPMLAHVIDAAKASTLFDLVVVSTEDAEIAEAARAWGAEVPFLRRADLADDVTPVSVATADALAHVDPGGTVFGDVCQLMANCPLVRAEDLRSSYAEFASSGAPAQISIARFGWQNPWWALQRSSTGGLEPMFPRALQERSQDLPELFCPTGAVWWARASVLRRSRSFHVEGRTGWEIGWLRGFDVDTEEDLDFVRILHRHLVEREGGETRDGPSISGGARAE